MAPKWENTNYTHALLILSTMPPSFTFHLSSSPQLAWVCSLVEPDQYRKKPTWECMAEMKKKRNRITDKAALSHFKRRLIAKPSIIQRYDFLRCSGLSHLNCIDDVPFLSFPYFLHVSLKEQRQNRILVPLEREGPCTRALSSTTTPRIRTHFIYIISMITITSIDAYRVLPFQLFHFFFGDGLVQIRYNSIQTCHNFQQQIWLPCL